jgi:hypothetical protein
MQLVANCSAPNQTMLHFLAELAKISHLVDFIYGVTPQTYAEKSYKFFRDNLRLGV